MNELFERIDTLTKEILNIEFESKALTSYFQYKGMDFSSLYRERLRNHLYELYDPLHKVSNFIPRSWIFRCSVTLWHQLQGLLLPILLPTSSPKVPYLFVDRPLYSKVFPRKIKSEYYEEILEHFSPEEYALVVDLHPREFLKYLFSPKDKRCVHLWAYHQSPQKTTVKKLKDIHHFLHDHKLLKAAAQQANIKIEDIQRVNEQVLQYYLPNILTYYDTINNLYNHLNPQKAMFVIETSAQIRAANWSAHQRGMTTFSLQHGRLTADAGFFVRQMTLPKSLPDFMIVSSKEEGKHLVCKDVHKGMHKDISYYQIIPLGCPRYDRLKHFSVDKEALQKKHHLPKDKKLIFWPTQSHCMLDSEVQLITKSMMKFLAKHPEYHLLLKLHPREAQRKAISYHQRFADKYGVKNITILQAKDEDTYACIALADVITTKASSVGMEAILMNKPVINFELMKVISLGIFEKENISLIARTQEELEAHLQMALTSGYRDSFEKRRERFIQKYFANFGESGKRIAQMMKEVNRRSG